MLNKLLIIVSMFFFSEVYSIDFYNDDLKSASEELQAYFDKPKYDITQINTDLINAELFLRKYSIPCFSFPTNKIPLIKLGSFSDKELIIVWDGKCFQYSTYRSALKDIRLEGAEIKFVFNKILPDVMQYVKDQWEEKFKN